ncbi:hypothetical protein [Flavobacterium filum]|nr:hypothetical protein [Flavobacterium filum]
MDNSIKWFSIFQFLEVGNEFLDKLPLAAIITDDSENNEQRKDI